MEVRIQLEDLVAILEFYRNKPLSQNELLDSVRGDLINSIVDNSREYLKEMWYKTEEEYKS